mgnify:CR=1 FL=1
MIKNKEFYAIKRINKKILAKKEIVDMTEMESQILKTNNHPNLMKTEYQFQNKQTLYFVMKFIQGGELRSFL